MSSWRKYGGLDNIDGTVDIRVNSMVTNYFTILKQITNDIDISGNLIVSDRLNVYGDVSLNQNLTVEGNVIMHNDLDISGNSHVHKDQYVDGNLTVLNHLYFQNNPNDVFMYGNDLGIAVNKEIPQADLDIFGNNKYVLNVKSNLVESNNILCRNVNDQGIMLSVDACNATLGYYFDNSLNIGNTTDLPDAYIQYNSGGVLHIDALDHVQIVANLIVTDNSANIVNDAVLTVYNDLENDTYLYDIYDVSSVYTGTAMCGVAVDNSANISINLISKHTELGGAIYGGAYPKDITKGMLSLGTTDFSNNIYTPAQTIVSGTSNVVCKNTTSINKPVPILDKYALDINGGIHIENIDITTAANIDFDIGSMRFSRKYPNSGIVIGGDYENNPFPLPNPQVYSQHAYITKDGGSSWYASPIAYRQPNIVSSTFMRASWVYDDKFIIAYGDFGLGYCLDISNNRWINKSMLTQNSDSNITNVVDIFVCDFSGNTSNKNALSKVFFITSNTIGTEHQIRYFNAAFGENTLAYANNPNYVMYNSSNTNVINDNTSPLTYYRFPSTITGKCIDGAGYLPGIDCSSGYIYIAGNSSIRKYLFSGISNLTEVTGCANVVNGGYNAISVVDMSNVVAVGAGFISHTVNGGQSWIDISRNTSDLTIENITLRSVWAYDASNAIAVGNKGSIVYTTDGYTWKNAPKQLFDLSGTGFPLVDASLNNVFSFNKNDFVVVTNNYSPDLNLTGYGKVIYNHVPDLLNSTNNSVLDLCGNMTIAGNIIVDRQIGNICSTGNKLYVASNTPNIYIGDGTSQNIYLGNSNTISSMYVNSKAIFNGNIQLSGGLSVSNGNVFIEANNYLVSHGLDVSYGKIDVININGGNALSRTYNGRDVSYALHVRGYRPAVRIDASLSVNQLYVDASSILLGPITSTYKSNNVTYSADPALSVAGYSNFGTSISVDGSNGLITLSSGVDAISNPPNNSYGGLYLKNGTGAYIDGNVYIGRNVRITGTATNAFTVETGTAVLNNVNVLQALNVTGNISTTSNLTISGYSHFRNNMDISGNVDLSGNLNVQGNITGYANLFVPSISISGVSHFKNKIDVSGNLDVSGNMDVSGNISCNTLYYKTLSQVSDYRVKTNVKPLCDTSFNIDNIVPKYYFNTMVNKPQIGFIAHELQQEYPFLVTGVKDGPETQGVDYPGLIGVLVKEIQGLKERVRILEKYTVSD
uniref:Peptidase S74 domain-containing protein n=1 Tax=viral metagenome TaxID=1070528 RepID=A0A6C0K1W5_9ZZZZ